MPDRWSTIVVVPLSFLKQRKSSKGETLAVPGLREEEPTAQETRQRPSRGACLRTAQAPREALTMKHDPDHEQRHHHCGAGSEAVQPSGNDLLLAWYSHSGTGPAGRSWGTHNQPPRGAKLMRPTLPADPRTTIRPRRARTSVALPRPVRHYPAGRPGLGCTQSCP
jgi:hypothetical protein